MASPKNILITGGSGLIGTRLTELLLARKDNVSHLGRSKKGGVVKSFTWNVEEGWIEPDALKNVDAIVNLAGASVNRRWTKKGKQQILESRIASTKLLYDVLKKDKGTVKTVVSASGISYYGFGEEEVFDETSSSGTDFLASVTAQWEKEADRISELGIRVVKLRTGIVLSDRGGALKELAAPVKLFAGAPLGTGKQFMSWIHIDDLCAMYIKTIDDASLTGAYNAVAPHPVTNREITKAIAKTLHKPLFLPPVPAFALKVILGEMSEIVLKGAKLSADKIMKTGFRFQYPELDRALEDALHG